MSSPSQGKSSSPPHSSPFASPPLNITPLDMIFPHPQLHSISQPPPSLPTSQPVLLSHSLNHTVATIGPITTIFLSLVPSKSSSKLSTSTTSLFISSTSLQPTPQNPLSSPLPLSPHSYPHTVPFSPSSSAPSLRKRRSALPPPCKRRPRTRSRVSSAPTKRPKTTKDTPSQPIPCSPPSSEDTASDTTLPTVPPTVNPTVRRFGSRSSKRKFFVSRFSTKAQPSSPVSQPSSPASLSSTIRITNSTSVLLR